MESKSERAGTTRISPSIAGGIGEAFQQRSAGYVATGFPVAAHIDKSYRLLGTLRTRVKSYNNLWANTVSDVGQRPFLQFIPETHVEKIPFLEKRIVYLEEVIQNGQYPI